LRCFDSICFLSIDRYLADIWKLMGRVGGVRIAVGMAVCASLVGTAVAAMEAVVSTDTTVLVWPDD
jgi:hypothetical protein